MGQTRFLCMMPAYITAVWDNGGATADRYTVRFRDGSYLAMCDRPTWPQGVAMAGHGYPLKGPDDRDIPWSELPQACRDYAVQWYTQADLIAAAARAVELVGEDELEAHAARLRLEAAIARRNADA